MFGFVWNTHKRKKMNGDMNEYEHLCQNSALCVFFFCKIFKETLSSDLSTLVKRRQNGISLRSTNRVAVN